MASVYKVCIPQTHRDFFDYTAELDGPCVGARVMVPFGKKNRLGVVVDVGAPEDSSRPLKSINTILDSTPLLPEDLLALCRWISSYYQAPLSEILALALPKKYREGKPSQLPRIDYYQTLLPEVQAEALITKTAHKQRALLQFLYDSGGLVAKSVLLQQGFTSSQCAALQKLAVIGLTQQDLVPKASNSVLSPPLALNEQQAACFAAISNHLQHYHCFLLQGVTGSGKTEVYLQTISLVLDAGKQVLVLVPEIGLTPQLLARFTQRFAEPIAVLHSQLNETERQQAWQLAKENKVRIVIGTRSAVLTPMPNLGLIVIDEEHDSSLKQMEGVRYSARDTALMRAYSADIPIILGSATPSLESLHNCQQKKYSLLRLDHKALSQTPLHYQLIDLRSQTLQQGFSNQTLQTIATHLQQQNQVLVFINRRGYAPVLLCHDCGWMADCKACDSHLTWHKHLEKLACHHCGFSQRTASQCPSCQSKTIVPVGAGTQKLQEVLSKHFPNTSLIRVDRDVVVKKQALTQALDTIATGQAQLIVGTQMLAKGHHFPRLSLVVILDADAGLYNQDFRSTEYFGQLLTQVAGRAGREMPGQVLIQTHKPDHPLLNLLVQQGYDAFAEALLANRKMAALPPFHYLVALRAQAKSTAAILQFLQAIKKFLSAEPVTVLGPAPASMARKAYHYRMQLLIKSHSRPALKQALSQMRLWIAANKMGAGVQWNLDVDPYDLS